VVITRGGVPIAFPATAKVKWTASVGALRLKPTGAQATRGGNLVARWAVPKDLTGKTIRVTLTVTSENVTVTKTHLHRIA
jgi:hypothetical protein